MKELVEELKKIYAEGNPKLGDVVLHDITEEHLRDPKLELTYDKLCEDRDNILTRERAEKIR